METVMPNANIKLLALGTAFALTAALSVCPAAAGGKGGKSYYSQTYNLSKPLHGYEGRAGDYYCSYVRTPVHTTDAVGRLKVTAWTLEQHCY
jgi:hypothetical protein